MVGRSKFNAAGELEVSVTMTLRLPDLASALSLSGWDPGVRTSRRQILKFVKPLLAKYGTEIRTVWIAQRQKFVDAGAHDAVREFEERWVSAREDVDRQFTDPSTNVRAMR